MILRKAADADDDKFGGFDRRDADHDVKDALIDALLGHGRGIAAHEIRLFGLFPASAPCRNRPNRKSATLARIRSHSEGPFGSNTVHCRPRVMLSSINSSRRRTGRYLYGSATSFPANVRAPQTTMAPAGSARRPFSPMASIAASCASDNATLNPCAPRTVASVPAGAFQTPRAASMRA